jgi:hypothetical protein
LPLAPVLPADEAGVAREQAAAALPAVRGGIHGAVHVRVAGVRLQAPLERRAGRRRAWNHRRRPYGETHRKLAQLIPGAHLLNYNPGVALSMGCTVQGLHCPGVAPRGKTNTLGLS